MHTGVSPRRYPAQLCLQQPCGSGCPWPAPGLRPLPVCKTGASLQLWHSSTPLSRGTYLYTLCSKVSWAPGTSMR